MWHLYLKIDSKFHELKKCIKFGKRLAKVNLNGIDLEKCFEAAARKTWTLNRWIEDFRRPRWSQETNGRNSWEMQSVNLPLCVITRRTACNLNIAHSAGVCWLIKKFCIIHDFLHNWIAYSSDHLKLALRKNLKKKKRNFCARSKSDIF